MKIIEELYGIDIISYECEADEEMKFIGAVDALAAFFGYDDSNLWNAASITDLILTEELDKRRSMLISQIAEGDVELVLPLVCGDGNMRWFLNRGRLCGNSIKGVFVPVGKIKCLFDQQYSTLTKYKERLKDTENLVSTLQVLSKQDSLTKLYNADTTKHLCAEYLSGSHSACALIMLDLDGFKKVNDELGHMEGDRVITRVASEIKRQFRSGDIVGRVGGDEFLVLMKEIPNADIVNKKCEALVNAVSSLKEELKCDFLGCSVGAVVASAENYDYDELFKYADAIMYDVKNSGGHNYCVKTANI